MPARSIRILLVPSRGSVVSASLLDATTVQYQLAGLKSEGPLTITLPTGAVKDTDGNDSVAFSESLSVDIVSTPFPSPFFAEIPAAPLVWERTTTGTIAPAGDSDSFTLNLDAGQTLSALVSPANGPGLRPKIDLLDGSDQLIASASAAAIGLPAMLQTGAIATGGTYTLRVSGRRRQRSAIIRSARFSTRRLGAESRRPRRQFARAPRKTSMAVLSLLGNGASRRRGAGAA